MHLEGGNSEYMMNKISTVSAKALLEFSIELIKELLNDYRKPFEMLPITFKYLKMLDWTLGNRENLSFSVLGILNMQQQCCFGATN